MESIAGEISKRAITVEVTDNMSNARDIMLEYNINRVIVVAITKPVGMVTEKAIGSYYQMQPTHLTKLPFPRR